MGREAYRLGMLEEIPGTGVGGCILDILKRHGHQTSANAVKGGGTLVKGSSKNINLVWSMTQKSLGMIDKYSSLPGTMLEVIKELNGVGSSDNSVYGETWSSKDVQSLFQYEQVLEMQQVLQDVCVTLTAVPEDPEEALDQRFRALATRSIRKMDVSYS